MIAIGHLSDDLIIIIIIITIIIIIIIIIITEAEVVIITPHLTHAAVMTSQALPKPGIPKRDERACVNTWRKTTAPLLAGGDYHELKLQNSTLLFLYLMGLFDVFIKGFYYLNFFSYSYLSEGFIWGLLPLPTKTSTVLPPGPSY